jgi:hypothetical protein
MRNRFEKPAAVVVVNRNDAGLVTSITLNGDEMPHESVEHAIRYGVTQWCQDGAAGAQNQSEYTEGFGDRVTRLLSGEIGRAKGEGREASDPIGTAAKSLARNALRAAVDATVWKALSKEQKAEAFNAFYEANADTFRKEAEKAAKATNNLAGSSDLLASLLAKAGGNG